MTLASLRAVENQIGELKQLLSSDPQSDEARAWVASLSSAEIDKMSEIFIKHELAGDLPYENLTSDEIAFLEPLFSRPVPSLPPIDRSEPVCVGCGNQPAIERGNLGEAFYWCDRCWEKVCPAGFDVFLARLQRDEHGNILACSTPNAVDGDDAVV